MTLLVLSIIALLVGPLLLSAFSKSRKVLKVLDGFIFVTVGWIIFGEIVPEIVATAGWLVIISFAIGLLLPFLAEKSFQHRNVHMIVLIAGLSGFLFHAAFDGAWLAQVKSFTDDHLAIGVLLHRIPIGLGIWWVVRPRFGFKAALGMIFVIVIGSVLGFYFSEVMLAAHKDWGLEHLQALLAGSLLHVIIHEIQPAESKDHHDHHDHDHHHHDHHHDHHHHHDHSCSSSKDGWLEGVGNVLAIATLFLLSHLNLHEQHHDTGPVESHFTDILMGMLLDSAPALLLAYVVGGLATGMMQKSYMSWLAKGRSWWQSLKGMAVGLPLPICSCGVVPLYRSLVEKGAPPTAAIAFLIATPELGIDAILISLPLLGTELTIIRLIAAVLVALIVGTVIGKMVALDGPRPVKATAIADEPTGDVWQRVRDGLRRGVIDLVDHTGPWIVFGFVLAAALQPVLQNQYQTWINHPLEVVVLGLLGLPMYVCASGATPLVAVLIASGVSPGAGLAFLLTGPATNVTTFGIVSQLHGKKMAFLLALATFTLSVAGGYLLNFVLDPTTVSLDAAGHEAGLLHMIALILLASLFANSIFKQGARRFVREIFVPHVH